MKVKSPGGWPPGWKRTKWQITSRFRKPLTIADAQEVLADEIDRNGGTNATLTFNAGDKLGRHDVGAAVYFTRYKKPMVLACDRYNTVADNILALAKTLDAMRAIERWGSSDMMERAYSGFAAFPMPVIRPWWDVLEVGPNATREVIEASFRRLALVRHPDAGGSNELMAELNAARQAAIGK